MHLEKQRRAVQAIILILATSFAAGAQPAASPERQAGGAEVTPLASSRSLSSLLPDKLAGINATTDSKQLTRETVGEVVGDKEAVYQEYRVNSAASREYSGVRVDVFETQNQFAAFGLFTFNSEAGKTRPTAEEMGSNGARVDGELIFWKGNFFVRVGDANQKPSRGGSAVREGLARAVANAI
ncbi:MAG: hypothetical protein DMF60_20910, partial [Acidobacteria bacterium]